MILSYTSTLAQTQTKSKFDLWPELKAFHMVMSQTFHPSEDGDLKPIKERSTELANKATVLAKSKIPAEFNNKEIVEAANKLETDSKKLDELIKAKATDEVINKSLTNLHDTFHLIVERCQKGDEHNENQKERPKVEQKEEHRE